MLKYLLAMMGVNQLNSVSEVIDAFGGPNAMARLFGGGPSRYCNYRTKGEFPPGLHIRLYVECVKRGLSVSPALVGMTPDMMAIMKGERQRHLPLAAE